jgi:hypothetical protein
LSCHANANIDNVKCRMSNAECKMSNGNVSLITVMYTGGKLFRIFPGYENQITRRVPSHHGHGHLSSQPKAEEHL